MPLFKCKMCGGDLEIKEGMSVAECQYCGTQQTLPRLDSDRRANLYDRANHFRRNNEYDKAMSIYEQILNEDSADAEAYWSLVLCRYGIEYVEDPASHKRVPTVNRAQFTSIFADEDYKQAIAHADGAQRAVYEAEAKAIDDIQKGILEISSKEEPFDVFICYKETDNNGRRTQDSVLANDLYHQLTQEGFKVFFSRITLEDKLGTAYEPYIFAALNSAKVMVVLGTRPEYFNAVWVRNEWSRYLALIKNEAKKVLIPAYRDMDPYDLPEEFSHLQAQDMSKLGFMQDLIRGIKKLTETDTPQVAVRETVVVNSGNANTAPLLKRVFMFLEDGDWQSADEYCEKVLDTDPECAEAYLGKLMAELQVRKRESLADCAEPFDNNGNYQKAFRFADETLKKELTGYIAIIQARLKETVYQRGLLAMKDVNFEDAYKTAASIFREIPGYKDADNLVEECLEKAEKARKTAVYSEACSQMTRGSLTSLSTAITVFESIPGWKDSDEKILECQELIKECKAVEEAERIAELKRRKRNKIIGAIVASVVAVALISLTVMFVEVVPSQKYKEAMLYMEQGQYVQAEKLFAEIENYKDSAGKAVEAKYNYAIELFNDEKYEESIKLLDEVRDSEYAEQYLDEYMSKFREMYAPYSKYISVGLDGVGLKKDSTVVAVGADIYGECDDVSDWKDIVAVSTGSTHILGLKKNGTVVAVGNNYDGQCDVSEWKDIVAVSAGDDYTVGLKSDGTVVAVGNNSEGQCDVSEWRDIVAVSAGEYHTVGLKKDGTVVAVGSNQDGQCDVSEWKDIVDVSVGTFHTVGLKRDGTVVAVGSNNLGPCSVSEWKDIVDVSAGMWHTVGLKKDGTVVAVGSNQDGQCDVSEWKDIVAISAGCDHTMALKSDGSVVAFGEVKSIDHGVLTWDLW